MNDPQKTQIADIGEFQLIDRIKRIMPGATDPVMLGIGDDTAAVRLNEDQLLLATCDIQIENTHFRRRHLSSWQLGRRSMAINISDIAAMGGTPTYALTSLGLPRDLPLGDFDDLFQGMRDQLKIHKAMYIGGNLAHCANQIIIDITLMGTVQADQMLTRSGAQPGDRVFMTGKIGAASAGFLLLENESGDSFPELIQAYHSPEPKVLAGQKIAASGYATSMIDISDGLASDMLHICEMSRVGVEIYYNRLPIPSELEAAAKAVKKDASELTLHGGEDYELLFTLKPDTPSKIINNISRASKIPITEIGIIIPKVKGCWLFHLDNRRIPLAASGWNHFA